MSPQTSPSEVPEPSANGHLIFDDVELLTEKVEIKDRKTGQLVKYLLTEAMEEAAVKWKAANVQGATLTRDRQVKFSGGAGVGESEPLLVSLCLYRADDDFTVPKDKYGNYEPSRRINLTTVMSWKRHIVKTLYNKVREMTPDLKADESEEMEGESPKNLPEGTTAT